VLATQHSAGQIHTQHEVPRGHVHVFPSGEPDHARVVHQHVYAPESLHYRGHHRCDGALVGDVSSVENARLPRIRYSRGRLTARLLVNVDDCNLRAFRRKALGYPGANAPSAPRHDDDVSFQPHASITSDCLRRATCRLPIIHRLGKRRPVRTRTTDSAAITLAATLASRLYPA